ncbi:MAG: MATE family efflux transporter [Catenisphaera adipataccumulans]|jgi:putative MATE family efflux protein|uniref:MATE family efflux transporter n=1 Tax=Catenisphaera adipataccumulans TaxID=700500 RepID=UPI003D8FE36E
MKPMDYENGSITKTILRLTLPMFVAQSLNLLYNIVDRVYIGRIPEIGTTALGAVGLCFPVVILITAFTNLYGMGGSPLFAIERGRQNEKKAAELMNTSFWLEVVTGLILIVGIELFARPMMEAFGAGKATIGYCLQYLRIYALGTVFSMIATGMNPFINAQGFPSVGMTTVIIGAVLNIVLDPVFIFVFGMGIRGAAAATVISQAVSALFVLRFLRSDRSLFPLSFTCTRAYIKDILMLGSSAFVMQITNSLVNIVCNNVLASTGGELYISIMTIVSSVRQMLEVPILAIMEGTSPFISFNYGARHPQRIRSAMKIMFLIGFAYALIVTGLIERFPSFFIRIFSDDRAIEQAAVRCLHLYFYAFVFMVFQYTGQTTFKALNKRKKAIFFSLLRKAVIVIPLTIWLPTVVEPATDGVFMAEPISNIIGGLACFITMLATVLPELKRMERENEHE